MRFIILLAVAMLATTAARAATPDLVAPPSLPQPGLTAALAAWREIPVLEDGRIMPLDTFARRMADTVCHAQAPKLATGPGGAVVRWQADELLLDWLARPAAWEEIPFLTAEHEEVRKLLGLPLFAEAAAGRERLKHAAPADVEDCEPLRDRLRDIDERRREAMQAGSQFRLEGADAKVEQLWKAFVTWRRLTFRAATEAMGRPRFVRLFEQAAAAWRTVRGRIAARPGDTAAAEAVKAVDDALLALADALGESTRFATVDAEAKFPPIRSAIDRLAGVPGLPADVARGVGRLQDRLGLLAESLYDDGGGLLVVPALHAEPLEAERNADDDAPPWLGLGPLLDAPADVLAGYPPAAVQEVRAAFAALTAAVGPRPADPSAVAERDRAASAAAGRFAAALRALGTAVEPLRSRLPAERIDAELLRHTAYPPAGSTLREVRYNESDPFRMSWVLSLLALFAFALAFGRAVVPMFWLGTALLAAEIGWTAWAFAQRVAITGWAPVTNMYETVIYVPFFLSLLGLFFLLSPICRRGVADAWRMTALPPPFGTLLPGEAIPLDDRQRTLLGPGGWGLASWAALLPRIALTALVVWVLAMAPYAAGGRTIINLLPQTDVDRSLPNLNNLVVWLVGLAMLVPAAWCLPRVALAAVLGLVTVPLSWRDGHLAAALPEAYGRRSFGLVVTAVAFAGTFIAWFFPIPGKQFSPLQPVLRDNFWLTIHVLTIVSSYAAGALAWGLGCLSLGWYLLGRYPAGQGGRRRPPEACAALAGFIYKAMQVAVLLLAAGTILGGLWADVSWGRFWGWDPKEVWALVSLLAYIAILHGRYAGWIGNFGLAAGSVIGAAVIGMSWYGVNFLLGAGLHSYGFGQGGQTEFFAFLLLNFALLAAAAWRWRRETGV
jgi:ABC-type transport system involved in cytochrome c biogenesis permease subunit